MINIIAAIGKNRELGINNKLIWHIKEDMDFFKEVTTGYIVVMGRKTFESIGRPLPNRENIVITRSNLDIDGIKIEHDPYKILELNEKVFIIGGESIYEFYLPFADNLYLTEIDAEALADSFFPEFDKKDYDEQIIKESREEDINFAFKVYQRKKNKAWYYENRRI